MPCGEEFILGEDEVGDDGVDEVNDGIGEETVEDGVGEQKKHIIAQKACYYVLDNNYYSLCASSIRTKEKV